MSESEDRPVPESWLSRAGGLEVASTDEASRVSGNHGSQAPLRLNQPRALVKRNPTFRS